MDRVFLDANVLFSAAYRRDAGLLRLWKLKDTELLSSAYAVEEARRNLADRSQRARLSRLVRALTLTPEPAASELPEGIQLPAKDAPILLAALKAQATHLLTGDIKHFGPLFGQSIGNCLILRPAEYLALREPTE